MQYLFMTIILLLSLNGCQEKEQVDQDAQAKHDAKIVAQTRAEVLSEFQAEKNQENKKSVIASSENHNDNVTTQKTIPKQEENPKQSLEQMGIDMKEDSITIDTNKTKKFLNDFSSAMEIQMKKISDDLKQGIVETKQAGIDINKEHIHIDLNKTQNMLEAWGKKIELFVQEFDTIAKDLENNTTNKGK
ncbi:MAG: hypothetical protein U9O64_11205 [Campylobacterota bacterium]|nr:hypothetical protein [Campylobacterota bacterium]